MPKDNISIPDGELVYRPNFFSPEKSNQLYLHLLDHIHWRSDKIRIFGKVHDVPRLQAWYGDEGARYSYSNIDLEPLPWTPELLEVKERIEEVSQGTYNSVLLNLYRNGRDSNGWHSDNEKELGDSPEIASLSLGQERVFHMKHKTLSLKKRFLLADGSLLIMRGETQKYWKHQIPKSAREMSPRINLTFRRIFA